MNSCLEMNHLLSFEGCSVFWNVIEWHKIPTERKELNSNSEKFNGKTGRNLKELGSCDNTVVVLENMQYTPPYFFENPEQTRITLKEKKDNYWKFNIDTQSENRFVLIETTDSDWKVYIDGVESEVSVYKNTFKSIEIKPGEHNVEFVYQNQHLSPLTELF